MLAAPTGQGLCGTEKLEGDRLEYVLSLRASKVREDEAILR